MKYCALIFLSLLLNWRLKAQSTIIDSTEIGNIQTNFPGGQNGFQNYLDKEGKYPKLLSKYRMTGCTYLRFVVELDSTVSHVVVVNAIGSGADEEAVRLIENSGKWQPVIKNGHALRTRLLVPIFYTTRELNGSKKQIPVILCQPPNPIRFNTLKENLALGTPLDEVPEYLGKTIKFVGKVYGSKMLSDTVTLLTCADLRYLDATKYVNVALIGKYAQLNSGESVKNMLIYGIGDIINYEGVPLIVVIDRRKISFKPDFRAY